MKPLNPVVRGLAGRILDSSAARSAAFVVAVAILSATAVSLETAVVERRDPAPTEKAQTGAFTGEYANGLAVYRLPAVTVVADPTLVARLERENERAHVQEARARATGKPRA